MHKIIKSGVKALLRKCGFQLIHTHALPCSNRLAMLRHHGIQTVVDVGANVGTYGAELRDSGYEGRIISFEPTARAFQTLQARSKSDPQWFAVQCAIGESNGEATIHVAANQAESSSLLPMLARHRECAPEALYISTEQVPLKTLSAALSEFVQPGERLLLKIDTQGYEHMVLKGAAGILPQVALIECELSFAPLYDGQLLFPEMMALLKSMRFEPVQFVPGFVDMQTGYNLQLDGIFSRTESRNECPC